MIQFRTSSVVYPDKAPELLMRDEHQPDGYLTEERKAAVPDQGFSTFFSETGKAKNFHYLDRF